VPGRLRSLIAALLHRGAFEETMAEEMRFHLDAHVEDLVRSGLPRDEALRRARVEFGSAEAVKEDCRRARGLQWIDEVRQDFRYAVRVMARNAGVTTVAVLSLGLGIAANTTIFSFVNAFLLRPPPVEEPHGLWQVWRQRPGSGSAFERYQPSATPGTRSSATALDPSWRWPHSSRRHPS
jgi:hypothetical protein